MQSNLLTIRLHSADNVVVARADLSSGAVIPDEEVTRRGSIPFDHKIATSFIRAGYPVKKYGQIIGFASQDIPPGEHVHTHNLSVKEFTRDYAMDEKTISDAATTTETEFFNGIIRPDGRIATRNYIGIVSTVNCSASVSRYIADSISTDELAEFSNIDGIVPLCHGMGCGMAGNGEGFEYLCDILRGYAKHPNFAGVLVIGLGCEVLQVESLVQAGDMSENPFFQIIAIQDAGGTRAAIENGIDKIRKMLSETDRVERQPVPASRLVLGLQCGGSDAYSGITANPALGVAVDLLVHQGGTAVLGETPEIYGAEHLLTRRAEKLEIAEELIERIRWWQRYTAKNGGKMDNNPSPGNKAGGLTTILEKSLGAAAKGGTTNLTAVYKYAKPVTSKGLVFMDTPGYDPVSLTGIVAGGANLVCFTTGRGSVYGCRPVPVIKLSSNTAMYDRMKEDMGINCGLLIDGEVTMEEIGRRIFRFIMETASGEKTKSEAYGIGDHDFVPWQIGAVMLYPTYSN